MESNDGAKHKFAKMDVVDTYWSYISKKINYTKEPGQYVIVLKKSI